MPALITQEIDDNLNILLIASPSRLSRSLVDEFSRQEVVGIKLVSPAEFEIDKFDEKDWYKVVLLYEHPVKNNSLEDNSFPIKNIPLLGEKVVVLMPLTTVVSSKNKSEGWREQTKDELELFEKLIEVKNDLKFIFYADLINKDTFPINFFISQFSKGLLVDPSIELKLQTIEGLTSVILTSLLKPQRQPKVINGRAQSSNNYLRKIKSYCASYYQLSLPIKKVELKLIENPILGAFESGIEIEESLEKTEFISKEIVLSIVDFNKKNLDGRKKEETKENLLPPPLKKTLIKSWNEYEVSARKLRLDLEHDLSDGSELIESFESTTEIISEETVESGFNSEKDPLRPIDSFFKDYRDEQKQQHLQKLTKSTRVGFRKLKNQKILFGGGVLITLAASSILIVVMTFFMSLSSAQENLLSYLESKSLPIAEQQKKLTELDEMVNSLSVKTAFLNKWFSFPIFSKVSQLVEISKYIIDLSSQSEALEKTVGAFFQHVIGQDVVGSLDEVNTQGSELFKTLSLLSAELKNYPTEKLSPDQMKLLADYQDMIKAQEKRINQSQQLSPLLPELLAEKSTKTYAVVLQNNQELRPTGGFIQAIAFLTFKNGILINSQVEDVYTLDQQLKAIVTPPNEVKELLGEDRWFLRDSNWNPNFPETAAQIRWFLNKSSGVNVDGIIGINLVVLEDLVRVLGQVEISEYNELITEKNLSERIEFHSEVQLVETTQNRDYSELVLLKILEKIKQLPAEKANSFLSSIMDMADSKELMMEFFDETPKAVFNSLGWNGSIVDPTCPTVFNTGECITDYLMQVEANIGVNKANYYLERQVDHTISISSNKINHKRVILFKNKAQTNAWPKGSYKAYVRFYLPENIALEDVKINDQNLEAGQIIIKKELNRSVVGVLIDVAVKSELRLQLDYSAPYTYQTPFTYTFFDQKQPGARENSPRIFLKYDPDLSPTLIAPQAEVQGDVIMFSPSRDSGNIFVGASFE